MNSNLPIYKQIKFFIKDLIDNDEFLPGESIPSERELAKIYGVNRMTIKKSIQSLIDEGILYSVAGSGTFVRKKDRNFMVGIFDDKSFSSISSKLKASGIHGYNKVISKFSLSKSVGLSSKLNIDINDEIFSLVRQRLNDDKEVIALEYFYTPLKIFPDIDAFDFSRISLYEYMEKKKLKPSIFERSFTIEPASSNIAQLLNVKPEHLVYCFEFIGRTYSGLIVEYTKSYIDTSRVKFEYTLTNK